MKKEYPPKCQLCGKHEADKKNSHIIPSFIMSRLSSSDGTGKRNHELTYSIGKLIKAYSGNEVPMNVMERNFDDLSEERINEELKKNDVALDNVFCSSCEKKLADYTESPYSKYYVNGKKTSAKEQYFFWMSVLWRVSHFRLLKHSLPKFIAAELRKVLDSYLGARQEENPIDVILEKYPLYYRIVRCKDYSLDSRGCVYAEYDKKNKIYSITLGDMAVCFSFSDTSIPEDYNFLTLGDSFRIAVVNSGTENEIILDVEKSAFDKAYDAILQMAQSEYINIEVDMIVKLWVEFMKRGFRLPIEGPSGEFIRQCLDNIHDENKKLGEKHTHKNFALSFADALFSVYRIKVEHSST